MSNTKNARYIVFSNANKIMSDFFNAEKELRKVQGERYKLSDFYEELAEYCGVSPSTISQIRLKNLHPSYVVAIKLAEYLNVDVRDLFEVQENKSYENNREKCVIDGCERIATTKGYCMKHIKKAYKKPKPNIDNQHNE